MRPRLAASIWVAAYLARLRLAGIPAYLRARGEAEAGAVLVVVATLDGRARAFQRRSDPMTGARVWDALAEGSEAEVEATVARQRAIDPDLWVIEIEDRDGRSLLDEPGLSD
ncbi:MAG: DUF1491 family protein [Rhodobacteraceae bacterium]|nr:DUF1491 family protein [Paracoccaceae bacterium]